MEANLSSLAYLSRSTSDSGDLSTEVAQILDCARRNNARLGITGALIFTAGCFIQVLEGPTETLRMTFECIKNDPRHRNVALLHFKRLARRSFPGQTMAFAGSLDPSAEPLRIPGVFEGERNSDEAPIESDLLSVICEIVNSPQQMPG